MEVGEAGQAPGTACAKARRDNVLGLVGNNQCDSVHKIYKG